MICVTRGPMAGGGWVATHEDITERRMFEIQRDKMAAQESHRAAIDDAISTFRQQVQGVLKTVSDSANVMKSTATELFDLSEKTSQRTVGLVETNGTLIEKLSGGERKRLYLLKLLMEQPNILLLDEPTNDLDLETLSVLEEFVETFPGVVITISHDRFFLDRTSTKLWVLDGTGKVDIWLGSYSEYLETYEAPEEVKKQPVLETPKIAQPEKKKRMSYAERKEWDTIEQDIETIEADIEATEAEMASAGSDYDKLRILTEKLEEMNVKYEKLFERWSYLQEFQES